jgi:MoaA/NifB/PqqE/SkfB family radical SAM enzyme
MQRVAVVFPPLRVSRDFIDYPYFADLGAVQAAAVLRAGGREVTLVDAFALPGATCAPLDEGYVLLGAAPADVPARVPADADAIVVAFTPFHRPPARDGILGDLLAAIRRDRPRTPIVLADLYQSGQHVVDAPAEATIAAYPEIDVFLRHEGEDVIGGLCDALVAEGRAKDGRPRVALGGEPSPLDALPLPAWDLVDLPRYFRFHEEVVRGLGRPSWAFPIDGRSVPALTSRGCPYRCVHCSSNPAARVGGRLVAPKTQRRYSAAYVDRLFADLKQRGAARVHLLDELVNVNERHFDAVMALLEKHDLRFEVPNGMRADYILPAHFEAMKGRMTTLSVSAESGVQRVVTEVVDKSLDLAAIREAARGAARAGLPMLVHFMIGLPGETRAEINGTLAFAIDLYEQTGAFPSVQFATPLPGTRLAAIAAERGRVLPLIADFGPHFQKRPSIETEEVSLDDLRRYKETFDRRLEAAMGPRKVVLPITYRCNDRCTFCTTGTRAQIDGDLARQRAILVDHRRRGATLLDVDGGEPTLSPGLFPIVAFARRIGYEKVNVTTNARMASYAGYAGRLARSGVTSIVVSIHGPDAATHGAIVGAADAFDQTCEGARNLARLAPEGVDLGAAVTVTRSNQEKLAAVADLVLALGIRRLDVRFLLPFGRGTRSIAPDLAAAAAEATRVAEAFEGRLDVRILDLPFCFAPGHERRVAGDPLVLGDRVSFVNGEGVDLFGYLRARRFRKPVCEGCPHAVFCGGFHDLEDPPDPGWLLPAAGLVRAAGVSP